MPRGGKQESLIKVAMGDHYAVGNYAGMCFLPNHNGNIPNLLTNESWEEVYKIIDNVDISLTKFYDMLNKNINYAITKKTYTIRNKLNKRKS